MSRLLLFIVAFVFITSFLAGIFYLFLLFQLPNIKSLNDYNPPLATRILATDGTVIGYLYKEKRILVSLAECPPHLIQAFVSSEDARFFKHRGVDFLSILRALWKNIWAGEIVQGGSTITQQVTKSLLLSPERSLARKIKEAVLSYRLDRNLSKEDILTIYLNQIYLGHGAYGVEAAARTYFGKKARDLTLHESTLLAGLPQAPSRYSPLLHFQKAKERQRYVLKRMVEEGFISETEAQAAAEIPVFLSNNQEPNLMIAPHFVDLVRKYLYQTWGSEFVLKAGLVVQTTLDLSFQKAAMEAILNGTQAVQGRHIYTRTIKNVPPEKFEDYCPGQGQPVSEGNRKRTDITSGLVVQIDPMAQTAKVCLGQEWTVLPFPRPLPPTSPVQGQGDDEGLANKEESPTPALRVGDVVRLRRHPVSLALTILDQNQVEGALLCVETRTGSIKALVGGKNYNQTEFNRAVQSRRQPGSSFKPIFYAAALEKGLTPATILIDSPIYYRGSPACVPQNFDHKFLGPTTLRTGLIQSRNIVSIKILQRIGIPYAIDFARRLGIASPLYPNLSLALGSSGVSLWEMVTAYNCFPTLGQQVPPYYIQKIMDRYNQVIYTYPPKTEKVMESQTAHMMNQLLAAVVKEGTGWRLKALGKPVAGKTGTTNDFRDAWFIGFTPQYTLFRPSAIACRS
ncbi:MAG: PBP1A family penicillin-binding protein [Deltaproteobacteria bacterium]|nr:PBP1A family penicillin-binding protein [Deltaproteobacteria bacterium]